MKKLTAIAISALLAFPVIAETESPPVPNSVAPLPSADEIVKN